MVPLQIFPINTHKLTYLFLTGPGGIAPCLPFPHFLYTCVSSLHGKSSSTGNLLEREDMALSVPDYGIHSRMAAQSAAALHSRQQRPYSVAVPGFSQVGGLQNKHTKTHVHTHWHLPTHEFTHDTWAEPSHEAWQRSALVCLREFGGSFSLHAADLRYSTGIALLWQAVSSFTSTQSSPVPKHWECSATLAHINAEISSPSLHTFLFTEGRV